MTKPDFTQLRKFMSDTAPSAHSYRYSSFIDQYLESVKKIYRRASDRRYQLGDTDKLNVDQMTKAISLATGQKVNKIIVISSAKATREPEWLKEVSHVNSLRNSLGINFEAELGKSLAPALRDSLWATLRASLMSGLMASLHARLGDKHGDNLADTMGSNLITGLLYYLGFVLADKTSEAEKIRDLIYRYGDGYLPISPKSSEPTAYFVRAK